MKVESRRFGSVEIRDDAAIDSLERLIGPSVSWYVVVSQKEKGREEIPINLRGQLTVNRGARAGREVLDGIVGQVLVAPVTRAAAQSMPVAVPAAWSLG